MKIYIEKECSALERWCSADSKDAFDIAINIHSTISSDHFYDDVSGFFTVWENSFESFISLCEASGVEIEYVDVSSLFDETWKPASLGWGQVNWISALNLLGVPWYGGIVIGDVNSGDVDD